VDASRVLFSASAENFVLTAESLLWVNARNFCRSGILWHFEAMSLPPELETRMD
jgi:hypothetical protein